jgi:hypothetical protein
VTVGKPTAFLGMPGYAGPTMSAARSYFRASLGALDIRCCYHEASLINVNCNTLWATALTRRAHGQRLDYFALLHADVAAPDGWLDALVGEMKAAGLDLLSVVVPIKDTRGLTSTAVGSDDPFRQVCRLSMKEVHALPGTFTLRDLHVPGGEYLLFNTGCFVCRFDPAWAANAWFATRDEVRWDAARRKYTVHNEPEDWHFARRVQDLGLKVGCTRKIPVEHAGKFLFNSAEPWGEYAYDEDMLDAPAVRPAEPEGVTP